MGLSGEEGASEEGKVALGGREAGEARAGGGVKEVGAQEASVEAEVDNEAVAAAAVRAAVRAAVWAAARAADI